MNILVELRARFRQALAGLVDDPAGLLDLIRPAQDARFGDYQANVAMPLAKQLGKAPRDVAAEIVQRLEVSDLCDPPEVAGPGFINLRLRDDWLASQLSGALLDPRLGVATVDQPATFVLDYSSPNVAKPMHVGHIRSTVIGDSLSRILRFLGHRVISDNHLGDWGTQFGMIIYGYKHFRDDEAFARAPVQELSRLYKLVSQLVDYQQIRRTLPDLRARVVQREQTLAEQQSLYDSADPAEQKRLAKRLRSLQSQVSEARAEVAAAEQKLAAVEQSPLLSPLALAHPEIGTAVLQETAKLHADDPENVRLWHDFLPACRDEIQRLYTRLDIHFDYEYGESFYHQRLGDVVTQFRDRGLARVSEGAVCVFLDGFDAPMIIQKSDGAYLYATTDLATIDFRMQNFQPDAIFYVVDHRQKEHFDKLFAAARLWGYDRVDLRHISFGTVLGEDGKPYKTRAGDTVGLEGLLDEAVRRAYAVVAANDDGKPDGPELDDTQRRHIAEVVGHAAIKYADLCQNRTSDYEFSYDKMVALEGNTATYMQYSYARTQSIFAKGDVDVTALRAEAAKAWGSAPNASRSEAENPIHLDHPTERALGLQVLRLSEAIGEAVVDYRPNLLTGYLFDLAKRFSEFYQQCKVLKAESEPQRLSRLLLCDLAGRAIRLGLELLGIRTVEKM
ncbi:MAG: arginine--tRNA ligase [Pirellulaceae bacterium]|nr:arginine--tRNA ligase [Pirellulaceae bacterium]